jgi:dihydroorotase
MNILIKQAKIVDPNSSFNTQVKDILIQNGLIVKIEDSISESNTTIVEATDLHISPGFFDIGTHIGDQVLKTVKIWHRA